MSNFKNILNGVQSTNNIILAGYKSSFPIAYCVIKELYSVKQMSSYWVSVLPPPSSTIFQEVSVLSPLYLKNGSNTVPVKK